MSLYTELNELIRRNGVRNTSGPGYLTLEPEGTKNKVQPTASATQQSVSKWQTAYPGIAVTVTVEGPYQNVRHFVRDLETSRQFLIINAVELEGVTQSAVTQEPSLSEGPVIPRSGRVSPPATTPTPGTRGTLVSLRVDLATYFRRANIDQASAP